MKISADRVHATVARVDYRVGEATQEQMTHDVRMSRDLATRFSVDYLKPFADTILNGTSTEPQLKRYERGSQSMTLVAAPVMNIADNKVDGVITVMLNGEGHKPEILLPHLDGISSLGSAILVAKTQAMAMQQRQQASAANSPVDASANANSAPPISDEAAAGVALFGTFHHVAEGCLISVEGAIEVDGEHAAPFFRRYIKERFGTTPRDAGIGETAVKTAETGKRCGHCGLDSLAIGDVADIGLGGTTVPAYLLDGCCVFIFVGTPDGNAGACFGDRLRHAETNAAVAAGDEGNLAAEIECFVGHRWFLPWM